MSRRSFWLSVPVGSIDDLRRAWAEGCVYGLDRLRLLERRLEFEKVSEAMFARCWGLKFELVRGGTGSEFKLVKILETSIACVNLYVRR